MFWILISGIYWYSVIFGDLSFHDQSWWVISIMLFLPYVGYLERQEIANGGGSSRFLLSAVGFVIGYGLTVLFGMHWDDKDS